MFPREFIFKLAPEKSYSVQMRFTLTLETFTVPRGMKLSALISNPDHESIFKIPWLQSTRLYSSLRVHLCQETENSMDVPQCTACRLCLAEGQHSPGEPEQCPGHAGCPSACTGTEPCRGCCEGSLKQPCMCLMYAHPERMGLFPVI